MSFRDMVNDVNNALKQKDDDGNIGTYFPIVASYTYNEDGKYGVKHVYPSTTPQAGPLMIITENQQRPTTGNVITLEYRNAILNNKPIVTFNGISYTGYEYIDGNIHTTSVEIDSDTKAGHEIIVQHSGLSNISGYISQVTDIDVSEPYLSVKVYSLASDGSRLLYGSNLNSIREDLAKVDVANFVYSPDCVYCNGSGYLNNNPNITCPDCDGYSFVGRTASGYLLDLKAADYGISQGSDSRDHFQLKVWARNWRKYPSFNNVKDYLRHFLGVDEDLLEFEFHRTTGGIEPETYWTLFYPSQPSLIKDRIPQEANDILEICNYMSPAGINALAIPYNISEDEYSLEPIPTGGFETGSTIYQNLAAYDATLQDDIIIQGFRFNGEWQEKFITTPTHYSTSDYGIHTGFYVYYSGSSATPTTGWHSMWSGSTLISNEDDAGWWTGYFTGLETDEEYGDMIFYDQPFCEIKRVGGVWEAVNDENKTL